MLIRLPFDCVTGGCGVASRSCNGRNQCATRSTLKSGPARAHNASASGVFGDQNAVDKRSTRLQSACTVSGCLDFY